MLSLFSQIMQLPLQPKELSSEVGPPQLMKYKVNQILNNFDPLYYELMISRGGLPFKM